LPVLLDEIKKGPSSLSLSLESVKRQSKVLAERIAESGKTAFIGSGSSYNAALPAAWLLNRCGFPAWVVQASDVKDFGFGFPPGTVPVLVSVSGNGEDIMGAARRVSAQDRAYAPRQDRGQEQAQEPVQERAQGPARESLQEAVQQPVQRPFAVCNTPGAPLLQYVEDELLLGVDPQRSEAATHTFIASMGTLLWLALDILEVSEFHGALGECQATRLKSALTGLPRLMNVVFERSLSLIPSILDGPGDGDLSKRGFFGQNMALVGLGPSYASALDGALKIQEVAQVLPKHTQEKTSFTDRRTP